MRGFSRTAAGILTISALAACSGGGGSPTPSTPKNHGTPGTTTQATKVALHLFFPSKQSATSKRGPQASASQRSRDYVSPSTESVIIQVNTLTGGQQATFSDTAYNLSTPGPNVSCTTSTQNGVTGTACTIELNAPATTASSSDVFYIFAYDALQNDSNGNALTTVPVTYTPAGNLLSEDIGGPTGGGDVVPSAANGLNPNGIVMDQENNLSFRLDPVPFGSDLEVTLTPYTHAGSNQYDFRGTEAYDGGGADLGAGALVLSAPGTGGESNPFTIFAYDYDGLAHFSFIYQYLYNGDPGTYDGPIPFVSTNTPSGSFATQIGGVAASSAPSEVVADDAQQDATTSGGGITVDYTSPSQPSSASGPVDYATYQVGNGFTGGLNATTTYAATSSNSPSFTVAPLFGYATGTATGGGSSSATVYALQQAIPTGETQASYTLTPEADTTSTGGTNECSSVFNAPAASNSNLTTPQQASFTVSAAKGNTPGDSCTFDLSDGISKVAVTLQATGSNTVIFIPPYAGVRSNGNAALRKHAH